MVTNCGYKSGGKARFTVEGANPCKSPIVAEIETSTPVSITNVENDSTKYVAFLSKDPITPCGDATEVKAVIRNIGLAATKSTEKIQITMDPGLSYVPMSMSCSHNIPFAEPDIDTLFGGVTTYKWEVDSGVVPGDSMVICFEVQGDEGALECDSAFINLESISEAEAFCTSTGDTCTVFVQTNANEAGKWFDIVKPDLEIVAVSAYSDCAPGAEAVTVSVDIYNNSTETQPASSGMTVSLYYDVDVSGSYTVGDLLKGTLVWTDSVGAMDTITILGTINVEPGQVCPLVIVVDTTLNDCICEPDEYVLDNIQYRNAIGGDEFCVEVDDHSVGCAPLVGYTYKWIALSPGSITDISDPNIAQPTISYRNTGTDVDTVCYVVEVDRGSSLFSCISFDTVKLIVYPAPTVDAGLDQTICEGESTDLSASPSTFDSYIWVASPGGTTYSGSVVTVNPTVTTTYVLTVEDSLGCEGTDTVVVNVNPGVSGLDFSVDLTCLSTDSAVFTGSVTSGVIATWEWDFGDGGMGVGNPAKHLYASSGSYDVKLIVTTTDGCVDSVTKSVFIGAIAIALTPDTAVCEGEGITLSASGGTSYEWKNATTGAVLGSGSTYNTGVLTATTTYRVIVSDGPCTDSAEVTVTLHPYTPIDAGSDDEICEGESTTLTADAGFSSYEWTEVSTGALYVGNPITVSPTGTTDYILTAIDGNGCPSTDTLSVTVNALPSSINFTADQLCLTAGATNFSGSAVGSIASWSWKFGDGGTGSGMSTSHTYSSPGLYDITLIVTTTDGCVDSITKSVAIDEIDLVVSPDESICPGESTTLSASGGTSFTWYDVTSGRTLVGSGSTYTTPALSTAATYRVVAENGSCVDSADIDVSIYVPAAISAGSDETICEGEDVTLSATAGFVSYSWTEVATGATYTGESITVSPTVSSDYIVVGVDVNGCENSDTVNVTIYPSITGLSFDVSSTCASLTPTTFTGSGSASPSSITSWSWKFGDGGTGSGMSTSHTYASGGTYDVTLTVTTSDGCVDSIVQTVEVGDISITATPDTSVCPGEGITLSASGGTGYVWKDVTAGGTVVGTLPSYTTPGLTVATTYRVIVSLDSCVDSTEITVGINVLGLIDAGSDDTICEGESITLSATAGYTGYVWTEVGTGSTYSGQTVTVSPSATTDYIVVASDSNGCEIGDTLSVTVAPLPTGVDFTASQLCLTAGATSFSGVATGTITDWDWDFGDGSSGSGMVTSHSYTTAGLYNVTLTVTSDQGCTTSVTKPVLIEEINLVAIPDTNVCPSDAITLYATGGSSYTWYDVTSGRTLVGAGSTYTTPGLTSAATYRVVAVSGICTDSVDIVVGVFTPAPITAMVSDDSICDGQSTELSATAGFASYTWTEVATGSVFSGNPISVSPTVSTGYIVTGVDVNGCENSDTVYVVVVENPVAAILAPTTSCVGEEFAIDFDDFAGHAPAGTVFCWDLDGGVVVSSNPDSSSMVVRYDTAGDYDLQLTLKYGECRDSIAYRITITRFTDVVLYEVIPTEDCETQDDGEINLEFLAGFAPYNVQVTSSNGYDSTNVLSTPTGVINHHNLLSGYYNIRIVDADGCVLEIDTVLRDACVDTIYDTLYHTGDTLAGLCIPQKNLWVPADLSTIEFCDGDTADHGRLEILSADSNCVYVNYISDSGYVGNDTLCFIARDSLGNVDTTTVIITTYAPIDTIYDTTLMNTPIVICVPQENLWEGVSSISFCDHPDSGSVGLVTGTDTCVVYTPDSGFTGNDTFCVIAVDSAGNVDTTIVVVTVYPPTDTIYDTTTANTPITVCVPQERLEEAVEILNSCTDPSNGTWVLPTAPDTCIVYTPNPDYVGNDTMCLIGIDSAGNIDTTVIIITVLPPPDTIYDTTWVNTPVTICVPQEWLDTSVSSISLCGGPDHGGVSFSGTDTCITYLPGPDYIGNDTFCVIAVDSNGNVDTTYVIVTINGPSDTIYDTTKMNTPITVCVPQELLTAAVETLNSCGDPSSGTWVLPTAPDTCIVYEPNPDYVGNDTMCLIAVDSSGNIDTTTIIITVLPPPDTIYDTTYVGTPDTICLEDYGYTDTSITITTCDGGDTTVCGGTYSYDPLTNCIVYTPPAGKTGSDTGCLVVVDSTGTPIDTIVHIEEILPFPPDTIYDTTYYNTPITVCVPQENLSEAVELLSSCGDPVNGTWVLPTAPDTCLVYTPNPGYVGNDTMCMIAVDSAGNVDTTTIIITITPGPDTIYDTTTVDVPLMVCVPQELLEEAVETLNSCGDPANGTWVLPTAPDTCIVYTPNPGYVGNDTMCLIAVDSAGNIDTTTIIITVLPKQPIDTIYDTTLINTPIVICVPQENLSGGIDSVGVCGDADSGTVTITVINDTCVVYTPDSGFTGSDTFCIVAVDSLGNTDTTIVIVEVIPPYPPDTIYDTTWVNTPILVCVPQENLTGPVASVGYCGYPDSGVMSLTSPTDTCILYDPNMDYVGNDTMCLVVTDSNGNVDTTYIIITVIPRQDTIYDTTRMNTPITVCVTTDNLMSGIDSVGSCGDPVNGTWTLPVAPDSCLTFTPDSGYVGNDTMCVVVYDSLGNVDTTTVIITVIAPPDTIYDTTAYNTPITVCVPQVNLSSGVVSVSSCGDPDSGLMGVTATDTCIIYYPDSGFIGNDTMCLVVTDSNGNVDTTTIIITVLPPCTWTYDTVLLGCDDRNDSGNYELCIPIDPFAIEAYDIFVGGMPYLGYQGVCIPDTSRSYDLSLGTGLVGCSTLTLTSPWTKDGDTLLSSPSSYSSIGDLVSDMSVADPTGGWSWDGVQFISTTNYGSLYSKLEIFSGCAFTSNEIFINTVVTYGGTTIEVPSDTCLWVTLEDTATGCITDSIYVCGFCITPDTVYVMVPPGGTDTTCLDLGELGSGPYTITTCDSMNVTYGGDTVMFDGDSCVVFTAPLDPTWLGDTACIIICDTFGNCDTTIIVYSPECDDSIFVEDSMLIYNCEGDSVIPYCIALDPLDASSYDIFMNGQPYLGYIGGCSPDTTRAYDLSLGTGLVGCTNLELTSPWTKDGDTLIAAPTSYSAIDSLLADMVSADPTGGWSWDGVQFISTTNYGSPMVIWRYSVVCVYVK